MPSLRKCDLSVIIPVYNLEHYITPMLECLKEQDTGDYKVEYIFVLNNCSDRSEDVIRESGLDCIILECEPQGCGCARNVGYEHAQGEYVWFMDGDDWLTDRQALKFALDTARGENIIRVPFVSDNYHYQYFSMVWQYVIKKDFVKEFRFRQMQPGEDDEYMKQVLRKAGYDTYYYLVMPTVTKPLYYYNFLREGSNMWRVYRGENINQ